MDKSQQQKNFKKLQAIWKKKLKESGFVDIEKNEDILKQYVTSKNSKGKLNGATLEDRTRVQEVTQDYYRMAGHFLHDYKFSDDDEKRIWTLHAEGLSLRQIVKIISTRRHKISRHSIHMLVKDLAAKMIKMYRNNDDQE